MNFFYLLEEERKRLGLSQAEAGHVCGVSREMWGKYERDQATPGADVLEAFAAAGADVNYILSGRITETQHEEPHQVRQDVLPYGLSADEAALLAAYREIDPAARATLQNLLKLIAGAGQVVAAPKPASTYKPRQHFGVGAQPGKVRFQTGQEKRPLTTGKAKPAAGRKSKKENE